MSSRASRSGSCAAVLDLLVEHLVDPIAVADEAAPGAARAEVPSHELDAEDRVDRGQPRQQALQLGDAVGVGDPEDRSDDHLHRDRLGDRSRADRVARAPAVDLAVRDLLDQLGVVRDRLAVKRRQHQLAHAHVTLPVEQQDRRRPGDRLHHLPRLADVVLRRLPLEHLLDQLAVGDVEDLAHDRVVGAEDGAVAPAQRQPRLDRADDAEPGLQRARKARAGNVRGRLRQAGQRQPVARQDGRLLSEERTLWGHGSYFHHSSRRARGASGARRCRARLREPPRSAPITKPAKASAKSSNKTASARTTTPGQAACPTRRTAVPGTLSTKVRTRASRTPRR